MNQTWLLGCKSNFLFANKGINKGRFADIGTTKNRKLGFVIFRAIPSPSAAFDELNLLDTRVAGVRAEHNVGAWKDHFFGDLIGVDSRRNKQHRAGESSGIGD